MSIVRIARHKGFFSQWSHSLGGLLWGRVPSINQSRRKNEGGPLSNIGNGSYG
jgi:hypothetical protein